MRVLVVEDEPKLAELLRRGLRNEGMAVDVLGDGEAAVRRASATAYDVVILDVMLPGMDGFDTCREIRARGVAAPILMLTARGSVEDRAVGLNGGADDYVVKPFAFEELLARVRALARRGPIERSPLLEAGDLRMDPAAHRAWRDTTVLDLSAKEFALLETFLRHPDQVLGRAALLDRVWDAPEDVASNVVEVHIRNLREKIDRPFGTHSIETVRGVGYRLCAQSV